MKLLIVEDNDQMRRLMKNMMSDLAETINECRDGSQALDAYIADRPDWVLMDIKMAEIDGIAATRLLKASCPEANIIIVTDYDDAKLRLAASLAGACHYVIKENLLVLRQIISQAEVCK